MSNKLHPPESSLSCILPLVSGLSLKEEELDTTFWRKNLNIRIHIIVTRMLVKFYIDELDESETIKTWELHLLINDVNDFFAEWYNNFHTIEDFFLTQFCVCYGQCGTSKGVTCFTLNLLCLWFIFAHYIIRST